MRRAIQLQEGGSRCVCVCWCFRGGGGRRTPKTKGRASRITVPAVSVGNYASAFPGSRERRRNSHGIVNSRRKGVAEDEDEDRAARRDRRL